MNEPAPLSKQEVALLIRAVWQALLAPSWKKDDLIELGKLVFAKIPIESIDRDLFSQLMPNLCAVARDLGRTLSREARPPEGREPPKETPADLGPKLSGDEPARSETKTSGEKETDDA